MCFSLRCGIREKPRKSSLLRSCEPLHGGFVCQRTSCYLLRRVSCFHNRSISVMSIFPSSWRSISRPIPAEPERVAPGDGLWPCEERPEPGRRSEWRRRQASRTASTFLCVEMMVHCTHPSRDIGREGHDAAKRHWRGCDAHQGLAEGLGPWRVGWSGPGRIGGGGSRRRAGPCRSPKRLSGKPGVDVRN